MLYKKCVAPVRMIIVVDVAYKSHEQLIDCLALRGCLVLLVGSQTSTYCYPGGDCYVLDFVSKRFTTV
eukprot:85670-Prorocentrum_lima.AAC.1